MMDTKYVMEGGEIPDDGLVSEPLRSMDARLQVRRRCQYHTSRRRRQGGRRALVKLSNGLMGWRSTNPEARRYQYHDVGVIKLETPPSENLRITTPIGQHRGIPVRTSHVPKILTQRRNAHGRGRRDAAEEISQRCGL